MTSYEPRHEFCHDYPYDDPDSPFYSRAAPYLDDAGWRSPERLERLTHLVLVDGRLVDTWSEPVEGTRWQGHADRFDRDLRRPAPGPPPPPPTPPYDLVLEWLSEVCGGERGLLGLDTEPLPVDEAELPLHEVALPARRRVEAVAELLEAAGEACFDAETERALRRALLLVWDADPDTLLRARTAAHAAGGLCWAVGRANGLFGTQGLTTQKQVQEALALPAALAGTGTAVQRALRGFSPFESRRPSVVPDLLALGHPTILVSPTRRVLVRLRDRALVAREAGSPADAVLP